MLKARMATATEDMGIPKGRAGGAGVNRKVVDLKYWSIHKKYVILSARTIVFMLAL